MPKPLEYTRDSDTASSEDKDINLPGPSQVTQLVVFIEKIVFQTNLYATQLAQSFKPMDLQEMYKFLALNLLMGMKKLPSYRDYWCTSEDLYDSYISTQMSVKRFFWILSHLHLNDNSLCRKKCDAKYDKLFKIHPLISHLSERFLSVFHPSENQAIDESMIRFKGRSS
ncbi:piggyBac transposable element-derived protein 3 [Trichonephila clavipes]|nr:piggyBac transposable element-derived protein 3 [Trichonephila clavipes]